MLSSNLNKRIYIFESESYVVARNLFYDKSVVCTKSQIWGRVFISRYIPKRMSVPVDPKSNKQTYAAIADRRVQKKLRYESETSLDPEKTQFTFPF